MHDQRQSVEAIHRMDEDELGDALKFVAACAKGGNMTPEDVVEYSRQILGRLAFLELEPGPPQD